MSGAWIGNPTRLARYQPYFVAASAVCRAYGYWQVYRSSKAACADGEVCANPLPSWRVKAALILAMALVVAALGLDYLVPLFLSS